MSAMQDVVAVEGVVVGASPQAKQARYTTL